MTKTQFNRSHAIFVYWWHRPGDRSSTVNSNIHQDRRYLERIEALHASLGIPPGYGRSRKVPVRMEACTLVSVGPDIYQRDQRLVPDAARAWLSMREAAAVQGIELQLVSAYRSVEYQVGILQRKLDNGMAIEEILRTCAAPGYSEHHTGRAVDLTTPDFPVLEEEFEDSEAFSWLTESAGGFGFHMSFPRGNPHGVAYEPWHWAWQG